MHAWSVSDGLAGNARQADALLAAVLAQLATDTPGATPVQLSASSHPLRTRAPWRQVAPRVLPGSAHAFGPAFHAALHSPPRLAVGCGRQAALATRVLRAHGSCVVQVLDPRIDTRHWDLVVAPVHDGLRGDNVIASTGSLHPVDDAWLAAARAAWPAFAALPSPRTAVLIGGPGVHARFDLASLARAVAMLAGSAARDGGSVLATTSRRTPGDVAHAMRSALADTPGMTWTAADAVGPAAAPNPYAGLLAWADAIVCTADSVNMLSEACATRVPVWVIGSDAVHGRPRRFVDALLASNRIRAFGDVPTPRPHPITPLRETARIATLVIERLGLR